jgi:transposase
MAKRKHQPMRVKADQFSGRVARSADQTLTTQSVGALPILNHVLERMKLQEFLEAYLPREDGRTKLATSRALMVLVKNILVARNPIYGVGEWAAGYAPDLLGLATEELGHLNDDRVGRALEKLFRADRSSLALAVAAHVVKRFGVELDQLHNDSTSISFYGAYDQQGQEAAEPNQAPLVITWGFSKDHRPDLKQLLFILTVARDGATPVHFRAADGNVTDEATHRDTWELLCRLAGKRDFLYVADCKLATTENMNYVHRNGGRFITVLPRTRKEDTAFRKRLLQGDIAWRHLLDKTDDEGSLIDRLSVCDEQALSRESFRIIWFHSTRKAELDTLSRTNRVHRALGKLAELSDKLVSPRSRIRTKDKVTAATDAILREAGVQELIAIHVEEYALENYRQDRRGRPGKDMRYIKEVRTRCHLDYEVDAEAMARDQATDGVFPLITNVESLSPEEVLQAYKQQPLVEKRFSQLKTDFRVAPVYLKSVRRIEALLCIYFFVLMTEALLERELRQAMQRGDENSLPMYPEGRPCRQPTARRLIDIFETVERHTWQAGTEKPAILLTELSRAQRKILKLLRLPAADYGR